ncbi:precorrin-6y C5,15-methyltransferase (decarboxylating) subunit CbiE [Mumia sp. ZJ430]|uniref:precorrin-6y C5,15-methyltransferase (decarboxylating) subunit CbiE n=1 Tax=Mumia sp. ZJ430 TaxID=2708083 RepID=UPI001421F8C6|nr:precorrin-6y C5,15-methyltransferase (decarboxylating) subunit CbiE [Mumia sp. ZJ430]
MQRITVVGMGADGWEGLAMESRRLVREAEVVMGGKRHLETVPWAWWQVRVEWPHPLDEVLPALLDEHEGKRVVVLSSGDPLVAGIGTTLVRMLGAEYVEIVPTVSSEALARARMHWSYEETSLVSLVGRDVRQLVPHLAPGRRLVVLSNDGGTPSSVAALLVAQGYGDTRMTVLGDLGGLTESRADATAASWNVRVASELNVVCLDCVADASRRSAMSSVPGLPDSAFGEGGAVVPRDVRTAALARLAPAAGDLLWGLGPGAASVAIEWVRAEPLASGVVVEPDRAGLVRTKESAADLGVPELRVVEGALPEALDALAAPDAVFLGARGSDTALVEAAWSVLRPGGRLVVHAVTLDDEAALIDRFRKHGGELVRIAVDAVFSGGGSIAWKPSRPVMQWSAVR